MTYLTPSRSLAGSPSGRSPKLLRAAGIVALSFALGYAVAETQTTPQPVPVPAATVGMAPLEDWHGNVRRSTPLDMRPAADQTR